MDPSEYGGGGSSGQNYYDQSARFDDNTNRPHGEQGRPNHSSGGSYNSAQPETGYEGGSMYSGGQSNYSSGAHASSVGGSDMYGSTGGGGGYNSSEGYGSSGGGRHNDNYSSNGGGNYGGTVSHHGGGSSGSYDNEFGGAMSHAQSHAGNSGDSNLFSSALGFLSGEKHHLANEDVDEQAAVGAHQKMYGQGGSGGGGHSSETIGAGAAMQALKMFTGGGEHAQGMGGHGGGMGSGSMGGGSSEGKFIGMAMAQASKLFDEQHGSGKVDSNADKQSAVNAAGKMALKMYLKSQGGGSSGGGGLMSMASKFM